MKKSIHPNNYRPVAFKDINSGKVYVVRSTAESSESIKIEKSEYPLINIHISSSSHPFFTGEEKIIDIEGRVDKFKARREAGISSKNARINHALKAKKNQTKKTSKAK